ncbi:sporulation transcriptional regulator SpoIIID [Rummeliibacillus sp. G93]|uniref:Stage III sporulation protein D n=1 Tax=Rummeliibacillus stabekisii TaxID=241244 RepID=A0A143HGR6_9BACL|nr:MULTISPECIES: sporulation transcriptional regulator SpoIIID [Rummeliibacillus]AMX00914.1 stage III sporulation protein D [Rummeliibacillus stabekisii]MBB5170482.1 putative DeoR family transcriptional regulator (stage III sporulation protein D) [Rummeliibacillus stabekisii]MCM3315239.1 sporulation transcriptional regulator SpoIIID [Rummeliibacillus stabekisii]UQW97766.1 sporulation transcriptional regulator SpoIIID [Rummeliibacillus sp. G93]GEL04736.1 sporulation transcriptional regulator Sp
MHEHIRNRCLKLGFMLKETKQTVRALAQKTGYSKSTIHKDLTERLMLVNEELAKEVSEILAYHKSIRHIRGGEATRQKWLTHHADNKTPSQQD